MALPSARARGADAMRIIVTGGGTGGHLYPGLAIARALVRADARVQPFFVGARRGIERDVLPTTEFPHLLLDLHPLYRATPLKNVETLRGATSAWRELRTLFAAERPAAVVGTGGYAAGLALAYGMTHRVPIMLQEADSHPGLTTRAFARFAAEVFLGFPEGERMLQPGARTRITAFGNPIEPPPVPRPDRAAARRAWGFPPDAGLVLLVVGGSQGARAINEAVAGWVQNGLSPDVHLLWATGRTQFEPYAALDGAVDGRVRVRPYLSPIADAYAAADVALARAGAMTIAELCAWGIPSVLVPLPTAAADHQTHNARALAEAGAAMHVPQRELSPARIDALVRELGAGGPDGPSATRARTAAAAAARGRPDAAARIAERILERVGNPSP
jgi:UDP-N-acetylglucosamine--N-acetylmuramyl-(pentapeptide) pyrophosphoryl-undecaprenol N-acetylglucosamine transferase